MSLVKPVRLLEGHILDLSMEPPLTRLEQTLTDRPGDPNATPIVHRVLESHIV